MLSFSKGRFAEKLPVRNRREDGLDMVSGMRSAMNRCQQGGTKLAQLVHRAVFYDPGVPGSRGGRR